LGTCPPEALTHLDFDINISRFGDEKLVKRNKSDKSNAPEKNQNKIISLGEFPKLF